MLPHPQVHNMRPRMIGMQARARMVTMQILLGSPRRPLGTKKAGGDQGKWMKGIPDLVAGTMGRKRKRVEVEKTGPSLCQ